MGLYDYEVRNGEGKPVSLKDYEGKVLLIVNSATACGFTPQYEGLQGLYEKYREKGFEILDFPCNQFGNQAPGTQEEIQSFCDLEYGVTYPVFEKIDVNGDAALPLYDFLKKEKGFKGFDEAIWEADVVVSTLGPDMEMKRTRKGTPIADGHEVIFAAMKKYGKKRLVTLGTPTIRAKEDRKNVTTLLPGPMAKVLYPAAYHDMRRLGQVLAQSDLEWTVVRIIHLTSRHSGRTYGVSLGERPAGITVSRENVGLFIYEAARKNQFIRRMPIVFDKGIPRTPVRARSPIPGCC